MTIKIGDFITGKDRTYPRSIYKCISINTRVNYSSMYLKVQIIALDGWTPKKDSFHHLSKMISKQYRLATKQELFDNNVITQSIDFILEKE